MKYKVVRGDCLELLRETDAVKCIFADPPDNIGLGYDTCADNKADDAYVDWLSQLVRACVTKSEITWISFNAKWTFEMGSIFAELIRQSQQYKRKLLGKANVQVFTFGQHNKNDLGNNHRPLWRIMWSDAKLYPDQIKVPSWRQRNGDKRAAPGGRVPGDVFDNQYPGNIVMPSAQVKIGDEIIATTGPVTYHAGDVFDFPRVTGNSKQRCDWHPTQLHEELVERCIKLSTTGQDSVLDPFGGTGTTLRVCKRLGQPCTLFEMDDGYCRQIAKANDLKVLRSPGRWGAAA